MHKLTASIAAGLALAMLAAAVSAHAETVKIGLILPYSGAFGRLGQTMDEAVKLWMKENGENAGSHKIEVVRRDTGGPSPEVAKRLAQELIQRDGVKMLTGFVFTPEPIAAAPLVTEVKMPLVIMNA